MKRMMIGLVLGMLAWSAMAGGIYPLPEQGKAATGADLVWVIDCDDLTNETASATQTLTDFAVAAKQGVELVSMVLKEAFYDTATNANNTVAITVGDGTDADLFLDSTELNSYGTEVFLKFGRGFGQAVTGAFGTALVATTNVYTNVIYGAGATTGNVPVVTYTLTTGNAVVATEVGRKLYTAADTVDVVFTPTSGYALSDLDYGEVWLYFRLRDATK
jgi:hypothetical protein